MRKVIIILMTGILLFTLGGCQMTDTENVITKEEQIEFLKSHEQEITDYIKSQNKNIKFVQYEWDTVDLGTIGNGTPQGAGNLLSVQGVLNNTKSITFKLGILVNGNFIKNNGYKYSWVTVYVSGFGESFAKDAPIK